MPKGVYIVYTDEQLAFIKKHSSLPRAETTKLFNDRFNLSIKVANIHDLCKRNGWFTGRDGKIKKGDTPWNKGKKGFMRANKTSFAKGHKPHNHRPVGSERINSYGYIEIKVAEPRYWRLKKNVIFEETYGYIPKGHNVRVLDGNQLNLSPENLVAVSKSVNMRLNSKTSGIKDLIVDTDTHIAAINIAKLEQTISELKAGKE